MASTESLASVSSAEIGIDVKFQPSGTLVITSEPDGPLYRNGSTATLICRLKGGNPIANLSWTCGHENESLQTDDISTIDEAVLILSMVLINTGKTLSCNCTATHDVGSFMRTDTITFRFFVAPEKPLISVIPEKTAYFEGETATLTCKVKGGKPLASLSWECKGEVMQNQTTLNNVTYTAESTLVVKLDRSYNIKNCTCLSSHPVPSYHAKTNVNFTVYYTTRENLKITTHPINVVEGENVTVICILNGGNPIAEVQVKCGSIHGYKTDQDGVASSTLHITSIARNSNETSCSCEATNIIFPNYSKYVQFNIAVNEAANQHVGESTDNTLVIVTVPLLCILVIAVITVGVVVLCKRRGRCKKGNKGQYESPSRSPTTGEGSPPYTQLQPQETVIRTTSTENKATDTEQSSVKTQTKNRAPTEQTERRAIALKAMKAIEEASERSKGSRKENYYEDIDLPKSCPVKSDKANQEEHNQGYITPIADTETKDEDIDLPKSCPVKSDKANQEEHNQGYIIPIPYTETTGNATNQPDQTELNKDTKM